MKTTQPVPIYELFPEMNGEGLRRRKGKLEWDVARNIAYSSGVLFDTPAINWLKRVSYLEEIQAFRGDVLINLGSGSGYLRNTLNAAKAGGARGYVAIDIGDETIMKIARSAPELIKEFDLPVAVVQEDMLSFLRRLPNRSISVICSGVDDGIVSQEYAEKVSRELERTLSRAYIRSSKTIVTPKPKGWKEEYLKPYQPFYFMRNPLRR